MFLKPLSALATALERLVGLCAVILYSIYCVGYCCHDRLFRTSSEVKSRSALSALRDDQTMWLVKLASLDTRWSCCPDIYRAIEGCTFMGRI